MISPDQNIRNADWLKRKGQAEQPAPNRLPIQIPTRFIATIGGFGGPNYEVHWQRGKLRYRSDDVKASVVPSASEWVGQPTSPYTARRGKTRTGSSGR